METHIECDYCQENRPEDQVLIHRRICLSCQEKYAGYDKDTEKLKAAYKEYKAAAAILHEAERKLRELIEVII